MLRKFIDTYPILAGSVILVSFVVGVFVITALLVLLANSFLLRH